ncbi:MarR family winged helix-turn-helix transcriptional regulator [Piscinibacter koreensis]|uniref:MarR family transcriptional regulator n=1 Tax=Piscinibacter koreensis TaxID=2742824 RepID=A0A7Y6TVE1_9BURK|nr:MarR family transcriptional regulator [Schlegelella koreensis]NUZ04832.1 MarR family transcriptional regulator [Schlegelella koreensis]
MDGRGAADNVAAVAGSVRRGRAGAGRARAASLPTGAEDVGTNEAAVEAASPSIERPERRGARSDRPLDQSRLTSLVGYAASRASLELRKCFTQNLGPLGLKTTEYSILMLLAANPDVNQKQLGQTLDISPPNMAVTLDRMVERGWVERVRSTRDRRAQQIHLTDAGRELVRKSEKIAANMESGALKGLSGAERALLVELLMKVVDSPPSQR